jgi:hypothetical protein
VEVEVEVKEQLLDVVIQEVQQEEELLLEEELQLMVVQDKQPLLRMVLFMLHRPQLLLQELYL